MRQQTLWLMDALFGRRLARTTQTHLSGVARAQVAGARERAITLLRRLAAEPGPHVLLGETAWGERIQIPLEFLVKAHAIITGGTGSGKTMAALALIDAILGAPQSGVSFGVLDAKGELFERTLYLVSRKLETLPPAAAEALRERLVIVDLASPDAVTSYNIASPWSGGDLDFFATTRVETLQELLPSGDGFSLRGNAIVKHALKLLAARRLPFSYIDRVLSSETFRAKLLSGLGDEDLTHYFRLQFPNEGRAAIAAVHGRLSSALLNSASLKLALSGNNAPDFRRLQDEGKIVLINCAGPNIPRATARTLQALFLSDIRQAVFSRSAPQPFLWVCDEAQNFFRTRQLRDNMVELLTMSRSFGSFFVYLTQNLSTAVQDGDLLETLHTNIRWSLSLRGTSRDGRFLEPAFPMTGRQEKPRVNPYAPIEYYSPAEERNLLIQGLAHLPDRTGWLWLKSRTGEAIKIKTVTVDLPAADAFRERVGRIRRDASLGQRTPRDVYAAAVGRRNAEWLAADESLATDTLEQAYRREKTIRTKGSGPKSSE